MIILQTKEEAVSLFLEALEIHEKRSKEKKESYAHSNHSEIFLTRIEAAKFLKITLPTLGRYTKDGVVVAQRFGNTVRYRQTDLINGGKIINVKNQKRIF